MNLKVILSGLCLILTFNSLAQTPTGTWISVYRETIQRHNGDFFNLGHEEETTPDDSIYTITSYDQEGWIVKFHNEQQMEIGFFWENSSLVNISRRNDSLIYMLDSTEYYIDNRDTLLVLRELGKYWQYQNYYFEPLTKPSTINWSYGQDSTALLNSYWKVIADTNSNFQQLEFQFIDHEYMVFSQIVDSLYSKTSHGRYYFKETDVGLYFTYLDDLNMDIYHMRFFENKGDSLIGQAYELPFHDSIYFKSPLSMYRPPLPDSAQLANIADQLTGTWVQAEKRTDTLEVWYQFDTYENQFFEITFQANGQYQLTYGGDYRKDGKVYPFKNGSTGTWQLGGYGKYLKLTGHIRKWDYLTINRLNDQELAISLNLKALYSLHDIEYYESSNDQDFLAGTDEYKSLKKVNRKK